MNTINNPPPSSVDENEHSDFDFIFSKMMNQPELEVEGATFRHSDMRRLVISVAQLCNQGTLAIVPWLTSDGESESHELWDEMAEDMQVHPLVRFGHVFVPADEETGEEAYWEQLGFGIGLATHPKDLSAFSITPGERIERRHMCARPQRRSEDEDNEVLIGVIPDSILLCPGCIDGWLMQSDRDVISVTQELALRRFASLHGLVESLLIPLRLFLSAPLDDVIEFESPDATEDNDD